MLVHADPCRQFGIIHSGKPVPIWFILLTCPTPLMVFSLVWPTQKNMITLNFSFHNCSFLTKKQNKI